MNKRLMSIILAVTVGLTGLAGCNPEEKKTEAKIDLTEGEYRTLKAASEVDWLNGFNEDYLTYPFFSDKEDDVTYTANAMYYRYTYMTGAAGDAVMWFGTEPTWYEWMAVLTGPHDNEARKNQLKNYIIDRPIREDGFIWNWYDSPHWPTKNIAGETDDHYHYDQMFRYINGVYEVMCWENSTDLLSQKDTKLVVISDDAQKEHVKDDASVGKTVRQKVDMAMNYILNDMHGKDGLVILDDTVNNGKNLGRIGDYGSNYWDNFLFGYLDAYENMLFYSALISMEKIELMCGNDGEAEYYRNLAAKTKQKFNETFWSDTTNRYIACIDVDGTKYDYGMTFLNMEAIHYGLADERQEDLIYTWLVGNSEVEGDRSTGEDIYYFRIAPRVTTVAMEDTPSKEVDGRKQYWYFDWYGQANVETTHSYGQHFQNGGTIFYPEYYDIMNRIDIVSPESALNRWKVLAEEYAIDELYRRPPNAYGWTDMIGITNEFPESGLIPMTWLNGFMGTTAEYDGLHIVPAIPEDYEYMGMRDLTYGGKAYDLTVYRDGKIELSCKEGAGLVVRLGDVHAKGSVTVRVMSGAEELETFDCTAENGVFTIDLSSDYVRSACTLIIE